MFAHRAVLAAVPATLVLALGLGWGCSSSSGAKKGPAKGSVTARPARVDMKDGRFDGAVVEVVLVVENESNSAIILQGASIDVTYEATQPAGGAGDAADERDETAGGEGEDEAAAAEEPANTGPSFKGSMAPKGTGEIPAGGSAEVPVEVELVYPKDAAEFLAFAKAGVQAIRVTGSVNTSAGELDVDGTTDFPTPRLLEGQVKEPQVASVDEGAAGEIQMDLVLYNPNPFPVKASGWTVSVSVADKQLKEAEFARGEQLAASAGLAYSQTYKVDAENWGPDYKAVLKSPEVPYKVTGTIQVGDASWPTEVSGVMKFHR